MTMPIPTSQCLASDLKTPLSVSYLPGSTSTPLIVFLTGLARPAASFDACISQLLTLLTPLKEQPGILVWDRYGQGLSGKQDKPHEALEVVNTLRELLFHLMGNDLDKRALVLVGNSIGCPIARLYAERYSKVQGLVFLDSMIAHTDFISIFDPSSEEIDEEERTSLQQARLIIGNIFHPSVPNAEGFNRLHMNKVVPFSDKPALPGQPWLTVIGHDPVIFADDSEEKMKIPAYIIDKYLGSEWKRYNEGLMKLTTPSKARGPIIATGADHFIQLGRPDLVAEEVFSMIQKVLV